MSNTTHGMRPVPVVIASEIKKKLEFMNLHAAQISLRINSQLKNAEHRRQQSNKNSVDLAITYLKTPFSARPMLSLRHIETQNIIDLNNKYYANKLMQSRHNQFILIEQTKKKRQQDHKNDVEFQHNHVRGCQ